MAVPKKGEGWGLVLKSGKLGLMFGTWGGSKFGAGGVGGRGTGPATCVVFLRKIVFFLKHCGVGEGTRARRGGSKGKMAFFEGCPVGWGKVQGLGEGSKGFGSGR